jgi:predicted GH43/DUF377 family glycosyl hydrolase
VGVDDDNKKGHKIEISMRWIKKGLIFRPDKNLPWMQSHASAPVAFHLTGDKFRIYFSSRDSENRSHVGYAEINIGEPDKLLYLTQEPVLKPGPLGFFDDYGVYVSSIVDCKKLKYMYYIGWNPGKIEPLFYSSIGLAVSSDGGKSFKKHSLAPIMARSEYDPCLVTAPCVIRESGVWRMWYISGFRWDWKNGKPQSYYHVKYAESKDGVNWKREGIVCIDHINARETNISRPCVLKEGDLYKMWYSSNQGKGYRIGYAESRDGIKWIRKDEEAGIDLSPSGWDSEAMAFPFVFGHKGKKFMLYNGNDVGRDGFGLAEAK